MHDIIQINRHANGNSVGKTKPHIYKPNRILSVKIKVTITKIIIIHTQEINNERECNIYELENRRSITLTCQVRPLLL